MRDYSINKMYELLSETEITDLHKELEKFIMDTEDAAELTSAQANFMLVHDGNLQGDTFDDGLDNYEDSIPDKYKNPKTIFIGQTIEPADEELYEEDKAMYFVIINHPDIPLLSWSVPNHYDHGNYVIEHGSIREFLDTVQVFNAKNVEPVAMDEKATIQIPTRNRFPEDVAKNEAVVNIKLEEVKKNFFQTDMSSMVSLKHIEMIVLTNSIGKGFCTIPNLESVRIGWADYFPKELADIASIKHLDVIGNSLTDMAPTLKKMPQLESLKCRVLYDFSEKLVEEIRQTMPNVVEFDIKED